MTSPSARRPPPLLVLLTTATAGGLLVALSLPPWGWWPLAFVGIATLGWSTDGAGARRRTRFLTGFGFGVAWTGVGMAWMVQLTTPGYVIAFLFYGSLHGLAAVAGGSGPLAVVRRPLAHTLVEALRFSFPFGGVPLASLGMSQVGGPLLDVARVGGVIAITWIVFQLGFTIAWLIGVVTADRPVGVDSRVATALAVGLAAVIFLASLVAPRGSDTGETLGVAAIQGGGEQGTSATEVPSIRVTRRHLDTTAEVEPPVDFVLWPENTIDIETFEGSGVAAEIASQAARLGAPIAVGITEDTSDGERFLNAQVIVAPSGEIISRYDKVRRVPFGEYVPLRGLLEALGAPVDRIGRDAVAGTEPAVLVLPDGTPLATVISWEVFFAGRVREGVREGGQAVLNPTNGASYTGTIVQTQQVASSRLRAVESGRWVVQAAPTGFTAIVDDEGNVLQRSSVSERRVLRDEIELRSGLTWYTRLGDAPIIALLVIGFLAVVIRERRHGRADMVGAPAGDSDVDDERDGPVVDEIHAHVGAEAAGGHGDTGRA